MYDSFIELFHARVVFLPPRSSEDNGLQQESHPYTLADNHGGKNIKELQILKASEFSSGIIQ